LNALIAGVGLAIVLFAVVLAWQKRARTGIFFTFLFGFLLVLIGSPVGQNMTKLSVSKNGIEVVREIQLSPAEEQNKLELTKDRIQDSATLRGIKFVLPSQDNYLIDSSAFAAARDLSQYVTSKGFSATGLVSGSAIRPGSIYKMTSDGSYRLVTTGNDPFPKLSTTSVDSDRIPDFTNTASGAEVSIKCARGSAIVEASDASLVQSADAEFFSKLGNSKADAFAVVNSVLLCRGLTISSSFSVNANGVHAVVFHNEKDLGDVPLGMKLAAIKVHAAKP